MRDSSAINPKSLRRDGLENVLCANKIYRLPCGLPERMEDPIRAIHYSVEDELPPSSFAEQPLNATGIKQQIATRTAARIFVNRTDRLLWR